MSKYKTVLLKFSPKKYKRFNLSIILKLANEIRRYQVSAILVQRYKLMVYATLAKILYRMPFKIVYHVQATCTLRNFERRLVFGFA